MCCGGNRNFELIKLRRKDLVFEHDTSNYDLEYIEVYLANRKGWQKKVDKGLVEADLRSEFY